MSGRRTSRGKFLHVYTTSEFPAKVVEIEKTPDNTRMMRVVLEVPEEDIERVREMGDRWAELTPTFAELRDKKS